MNEEEKVITLTEEEILETPQIDPDNPLSGLSEAQINNMLKQVREMMGMLEAQWDASRKEYELTDSHMKLLYKFNESNRTPPPEGVNEDEVEESVYDRFNGLNKITPEEVIKIFGEDHPLIDDDHTNTINMIKSVTNQFFAWMSCVKEYRQIHDAYIQLIEFQEEAEIEKLKLIAEKETNEEKKANILKTIDVYYGRKYLDFITEPLDNGTMIRLIKAFFDQKKVEYWLNRSRDKLTQLKISTKFLLEISQFEKRFLPPEYHYQSNIFLLYFMNLIIYSDTHNRGDDARSRAVCIVFAMDRFIRNVWGQDIRERILNNIMKFEDQFIGKLPRKDQEETE